MSGQTFEQSIKSNVERGINMKDEEKLYKRNGILYSTIMSPPENLDALKDLEAREDDVMLVAYPKCGCNWMVGVLRKIMTTCGYTLPDRPPLIEFHSPNTQKMLVMFRNPKDTAVSYYHFTNKNPVMPNAESWDKFFSDFITGEVGWGSYFDHALGWEKHMDDPNVLIVTFEELKEPAVEREVSAFSSRDKISGQTFEQSIKSSMEQGRKLKDEEKLYKRNGILYSTIMSPPENLDALKDLEAREDDVMLVAYPKCGE
ncbi:hypothetical protein PGIGA_G00023860 [Pangasianodon gigas]|uniref:Uncharacterized protein n=1 Tax=Pangasianodon gigas TaxID=30993 RepID=A0ACC5WX72_PANGG|nr:hypothetical protein [Pangasianodon gigas]